MEYKKTLHNDVLLFVGINSFDCYQCGKCSAGCPVSKETDFSSSTFIRMLQAEEEEIDKKLLQSHMIWLCISCGMCFARCPKTINIPKIMDYLRQLSLKEHLQHRKANGNIIPFYRAFLNSIKCTGRLHEIRLIAEYKLRTFRWLQDLSLSPYMFLKGKLPLLPRFIIRRKTTLQALFKKSKK